MAKNDIVQLRQSAFGQTGSRRFQVQSGGTPPAINAGEMVLKTLGTQYVIPMATSKPVAATDFVAGISASPSTETATVDGTVDIIPIVPGQVYRINVKTAATWNTQTKYNALVGARVTIDVTGGVLTLNASDGSTNGLVVEDLDITQYPGQAAFSIRDTCSYTD